MPKNKANTKRPRQGRSSTMAEPTRNEWREGRRRVLALLREFEEMEFPGDECDLTDGSRDGRPQQNVFYPHLVAVMATGSAGVMVAFASILSDYLGNVAGGSIPDVTAYERLARDPIPMAWPDGSRALIPLQPFSARPANRN